MRKVYDCAVDFPELNAATGKVLLSDMGDLVDQKKRYAAAYAWWTGILQQSDASFMKMTLPSACLNHAIWDGNASGFTPTSQCNSRNSVINIPGGELYLNVAARIFQGQMIGVGTSIGSTGGNASTELIYDHQRWQDPAPIRAVILSTNWGTGTYLESVFIDNLRVTGKAPGWLDPTYEQHGIVVRMMGETAEIGRVYVSDCNGHGVWVNGAGPGKINDLTSFDNNLAGLYLTNDKTGAPGGNSLGRLVITQLSCDNNGVQLLSRGGPPVTGIYLKSETGLSNSRGKPYKASAVIESHGWTDHVWMSITDAVQGAAGAAFVLESLANKSKFRCLDYTQVATNNTPDQGRSAIIADPRAKLAWRPADQNAGEFNAWMDMSWKAWGNTSTVQCDEPLVSIPFNGTTRLGVATTYAGYDYAAATPVWDPTGGTVPPPVTCTWVTGPWGAWSTCVNGFQTRSRSVTSSVAGCTPPDPKPAETETQACSVTPPDPTPVGGIDPADVVVVINSDDPASVAMANAYKSAWGITATVTVSLGGDHDCENAAQVTTARTAIYNSGKQYIALAMSFPSRHGGQSITSALTYGPRNVTLLTTSALYGYTGLKPRTDKGVMPSWLLLSGNYIRKDAHGTKPAGQAISLLANDSTGTPRGSARAAQRPTGVRIIDSRNNPNIGKGENVCNCISNDCYISANKPGTTPIVAGYQSNYILLGPGNAVWAKGFYGDHVTSVGGYLPGGAGPKYQNSQLQTALIYHLEKGAALSVGTVVAPWQDKSGNSPGSLVEQFVDITKFHPLFMGGAPVGVAAWSAVKAADRALVAGDGMCATFK